MSQDELDNAIAKHRAEIRERVKRHRDQIEAKNTAPNVLDSDSGDTGVVKKPIEKNLQHHTNAWQSGEKRDARISRFSNNLERRTIIAI